MAARDETLRVQDIPDFSLLVRNFSSRQLASFCRVLAMVAFEPEVCVYNHMLSMNSALDVFRR